MKAKEYLAKFDADVAEKGEQAATTNIIVGFLTEVYSLAKVRNVESEEAVKSIFRELNQKWNTLCKLDTKKRFKRNGFIEVARRRVEEDAPHFVGAVMSVVNECIEPVVNACVVNKQRMSEWKPLETSSTIRKQSSSLSVSDLEHKK